MSNPYEFWLAQNLVQLQIAAIMWSIIFACGFVYIVGGVAIEKIKKWRKKK